MFAARLVNRVRRLRLSKERRRTMCRNDMELIPCSATKTTPKNPTCQLLMFSPFRRKSVSNYPSFGSNSSKDVSPFELHKLTKVRFARALPMHLSDLRRSCIYYESSPQVNELSECSFFTMQQVHHRNVQIVQRQISAAEIREKRFRSLRNFRFRLWDMGAVLKHGFFCDSQWR